MKVIFYSRSLEHGLEFVTYYTCIEKRGKQQGIKSNRFCSVKKTEKIAPSYQLPAKSKRRLKAPTLILLLLSSSENYTSLVLTISNPQWFLARWLDKSCGRQEHHGNDVMVLYFVVLRPLAKGSGFYLSFEYFPLIFMVDKSQDHGKVLSIFV